MSDPLYHQHPYQKTLRTRISGIEGQWLELESTIFYPAGGGQPGDTGILSVADRSFEVCDTRKGERSGSICHQLAETDHGLSVGEEVTLELDWSRRYRLMRMHTGLHLLCSLVPRGGTGGSVGERKSRLDFDLGDHSVDKLQLTEAINALVVADHPVSTEWISDAELDASPELVRTMSVQPPRGAGHIRMVRIAGVDFQPCGGTHVASTAEIGELRIAKIENKGRRNRRIHLLLEEPDSFR